MKYYIIAGEASGDLHGSNLIKEIKTLDSQASIRCWGGDLMQAAGATLVKHYKELAFMGFAEVVMNLRTIFRNLDFCKKDIAEFAPDALILIDYPGFNMRIAKWARTQGLRIIYYISPQVWAWKENRVRQIKANVDKMLVILPFEDDFYKKWNYPVEYVGHPLAEVTGQYREKAQALLDKQSSTTSQASASLFPQASASPFPQAPASLSLQAPTTSAPMLSADNPISAALDAVAQAAGGKPVIALLPGSRKQEILKKLPVMLEVSRSLPDYQFVVAQAPGQDDSFYKEIVAGYPNVSAVRNQTYALLSVAKAACVTSGTATLETALFGVPEVVCYKGSAVSYQIAKRLIKVKYISLVNLIMDKLVVHELIQDQLTPSNLLHELQSLLTDPKRQQQLQTDYRQLRELLSQGGHASANAARSIVTWLHEQGVA